MSKLTLPEGFTLPDGVKLENLAPDPSKRPGCYLDTDSDTVYSFGVSLALPDGGAKAAAAPKDITGTKVKFKDGTRGVITEVGDPNVGDDFYARVMVDGSEIAVKTKAGLKPLTKDEIAAWDKEIEDAQKAAQ